MFFGAVPTDVIQQVFKIMGMETWSDVYVCCSGSFRLERAISQQYPDIKIHSNDVSVYSAAIGGLACGTPIEVRFRDRLEFVNDLIAGRDDVDKVAAVLVGCEMSRFARGSNDFNTSHFAHYVQNFETFLTKTSAHVSDSIKRMRVESYFSGDWIQHAQAAVEAGAGVLAFPPFFKGDYEAQFQFIEDNIEWDAPDYPLYDPTRLRQITQDLEDQDALYCILTDQIWEDKPAAIKYHPYRKVPHYCYANTEKSSYMRKTLGATPFRYQPVEVDKLTAKTQVTIVQGDAKTLGYVKDVYLSKNIVHTAGFGNYLIYLDGMLAGGIIYDDGPKTKMAYGNRTIMLLSDVSTTTAGKISKLIAMIATSHTLLAPLERKMLKRYEQVVTTARTPKPVSMKYRGIYKKLSRRWEESENANIIQYGAQVVEQTP